MIFIGPFRNLDGRFSANGQFHSGFLPEQNLMGAVAICTDQFSTDEAESQEGIHVTAN